MKPTVFNDKPIVFVRDPNAGCIDCAGGSRSGLFDICSHCSGGIFKYAEDTENAPNIPVKHLMCTCGAGLLLRGGSRTTFTEVCPACGVNQRYIQDTKNAPEPSLKEHISFLEHQLKTVTQANKDIAEELKKQTILFIN